MLTTTTTRRNPITTTKIAPADLNQQQRDWLKSPEGSKSVFAYFYRKAWGEKEIEAALK